MFLFDMIEEVRREDGKYMRFLLVFAWGKYR